MRKFNQRKLWPAKIAIKNAPKIKTNSFFVIVLTLTLKINNPEKSEIVYSARFCYESMPFIVIQIDIAFFTDFAIFSVVNCSRSFFLSIVHLPTVYIVSQKGIENKWHLLNGTAWSYWFFRRVWCFSAVVSAFSPIGSANFCVLAPYRQQLTHNRIFH